MAQKRQSRSPARSQPQNEAQPGPSRSRLELDVRRAQLLELGVRFFSESPYDQVSIDAIARAAGISKGLLYHYFPTKRDFYVAALRGAAQHLIDTTTASSPETPPLQRLQIGLDSYLSYVEQRGAAYTAVLRGGIGSDPEVAAIVEGTRRRFFDRLLEGIHNDCPPPPIRTALRGWIGMVEAVSLDWLENKDLAIPALRELLIAMLLASLQAAAGDLTEFINRAT